MIFLSHIPQAISIPWHFGKLLAPMGYHGVSIFLFLSGYGCYLSLKNKSVKAFCVKRLKNIIPPLVIVTIVASLADLTVNHVSHSFIEILLNSIGISHSILHLTWYIQLQYICYIAVVLGSYCKSDKYKVLLMISFGVAIYFISVICDETNLWGLNFASFSMGVCIAIYDRELQSYLGTFSVRKATVLAMMIWLGLLFFTYVILHNPSGYMLRNALKGSIAAFFILMICGIVAMKPDSGFTEKWLKYILAFTGSAGLEKIGAISYELYLCHGVFFSLYHLY